MLLEQTLERAESAPAPIIAPSVRPSRRAPVERTTSEDPFVVVERSSLRQRTAPGPWDLWFNSLAPHILLVGPTLQERFDLACRIIAFGEPMPFSEGTDVVRPTKDAINDALAFLAKIPSDRCSPHVADTGDGEIVFDWRGPDFWLDVGLFGDGRIYHCVKRSMTNLAESYEGDFAAHQVPQHLIEAIPRI